MFEEKSVLIDFFGDLPFIRAIDFLLENIGYEYSKPEIAEGCGIKANHLNEMWNKMEKYELVLPTTKDGNTLYYKLNEKNSLVKNLLNLELDLIDKYAALPS